MRTASCVLGVCGLALAANVASAQLVNSSFEIPGTSTVFDGWNTFENALPEFAIVRTGAVSLKTYGNFGGAWNAAGATQDIPVTPGLSYEAGVWSLHTASDPEQGSNFGAINIEWIDSLGVSMSYVSSRATDALSPLDTWQRTTVTGIAPPGAVAARVVPIHIQGPELLGGAVYFDDVTFVQSTPSGIVNPGFESDLQSWNAFSNAFSDTTFVHSGAKAAKFFGCWCGPYNATGVFQDLPAQPGQLWEGKAWVGTTSGDHIAGGNFAVLNIEFRDALNNTIEFVSTPAADANTPGDQWSQVTVTGIAPAGTVVARIVPLHIQPEFAGGAVWFDDVEFAQVTTGGCPWQTSGCTADQDDDDDVDSDDIVAFFTNFENGENCGDQDGDEDVDSDDIGIFFGLFEQGGC